MQIKLEFRPYQVLMSLPACDFEHPLARAFSGGYASMTVEGLFDDLVDGEPIVDAELPLTGWRHLLVGVQRGYDFHVGRSKQTYPPLVYVVDGVEYASVKAIPQQPDFVHEVATFNLSQPNLVAIDPCYDKVDSEGVSMDAMTGTWKAWTLMRDDRFNGYSTAGLAIAHESAATDVFNREGYDAEPVGNAGVDSGQCGFFDRSAYPTAEEEHEHEEGTFYYGCCQATESKGDFHDIERMLPADAIPGGTGINSRTYHGDGGYPCFVRKDVAGKVVTACLVFDYNDPVFGEPDDEEPDED